MIARLSRGLLAPALAGAALVSVALVLSAASAEAQQRYEDGMTAYEAGDFTRAARIWEPLAAAGDETAQYSLGKLYETGNMDLQRDYGRAVEWYRLASAQGVAAAQNNLGLMYAQGRGVARDATRAAELWSSAAKKNHPMAQFNLGLAYFRGEGLPEDKAEAGAWFRRAADLGLPDAQYALGQILLHGLTAEADREQALAWYQLAAAQGHGKAKEQARLLRNDGVKPRMMLKPGETGPATMTAQAPAAKPAAEPRPVAPAAAPAPKPAASPAAPKVPPARIARAPSLPQQAPAAAAEPQPQPQPQPLPKSQAKRQIARAGTGAAASPAGGRFEAWLFSARNEGEAVRYLRKIEGEHRALLAGAGGAVKPVQFEDKSVYYRVLAGGFSEWQEGLGWCKTLQRQAPGTFCKVLPSRAAGN